MARGFYQIPIALEDCEKTAVVTPLGKFIFNVMPFGFRNAPATFQRLMDECYEIAPISRMHILTILPFLV